ncbi:hypothetical protein Glove_334g44 [Diversispora epigaea]|uniref:Uncharacterized protein n=1 Tax=Diversispora epigaea TaxID=1348612 RepID=A0A397HIG5_9GLOM|nr:hypothetical protein Glove_334g44 [Diversispora epigaea]
MPAISPKLYTQSCLIKSTTSNECWISSISCGIHDSRNCEIVMYLFSFQSIDILTLIIYGLQCIHANKVEVLKSNAWLLAVLIGILVRVNLTYSKEMSFLDQTFSLNWPKRKSTHGKITVYAVSMNSLWMIYISLRVLSNEYQRKIDHENLISDLENVIDANQQVNTVLTEIMIIKNQYPKELKIPQVGRAEDQRGTTIFSNATLGIIIQKIPYYDKDKPNQRNRFKKWLRKITLRLSSQETRTIQINAEIRVSLKEIFLKLQKLSVNYPMDTSPTLHHPIWVLNPNG